MSTAVFVTGDHVVVLAHGERHVLRVRARVDVTRHADGVVSVQNSWLECESPFGVEVNIPTAVVEGAASPAQLAAYCATRVATLQQELRDALAENQQLRRRLMAGPVVAWAAN